MTVGHTIHKRDDEIESGVEHGMKLTETLHHPGALLGNHFDALKGKQNGNDHQNDSQNQKTTHNNHESLLLA